MKLARGVPPDAVLHTPTLQIHSTLDQTLVIIREIQYVSSFRDSFVKLRRKLLGSERLAGINGTASVHSSLWLAGDKLDSDFDRYESGYILWKNEINAIMWFEDLLVSYDCNIQL